VHLFDLLNDLSEVVGFRSLQRRICSRLNLISLEFIDERKDLAQGMLPINVAFLLVTLISSAYPQKS